MGLAYPRTSVAMLADSGDSDRGFNSSALSIADSLGGALTISASGVVFAVATRSGADEFALAIGLGTAVAALAVLAASRTAALNTDVVLTARERATTRTSGYPVRRVSASGVSAPRRTSCGRPTRRGAR